MYQVDLDTTITTWWHSDLFQYHALGLLYHIKQNDRLAVSKLIARYTKHSLRSPYAACMLVSLTVVHLTSSLITDNSLAHIHCTIYTVMWLKCVWWSFHRPTVPCYTILTLFKFVPCSITSKEALSVLMLCAPVFRFTSGSLAVS